MKTKIDPVEEARKARSRRIKFRAFRKQSLIRRCADQAIAAKRQLIETGKGNNGLSMNTTLLERHYSVR